MIMPISTAIDGARQPAQGGLQSARGQALVTAHGNDWRLSLIANGVRYLEQLRMASVRMVASRIYPSSEMLEASLSR